MKIEYFGMTDTGRVRVHNEDAWSADPETGLFIVSDGIGGGPAGEKISQAVVEGLPLLIKESGDNEDIDSRALLCRSIKILSTQIREFGENIGLTPGFGATIVTCWIRKTEAIIAHMGDSRAYFFKKGKLERKTTDHSLVQMMLNIGILDKETASMHPLRNVVTRNMGMTGEAEPDICRVQLGNCSSLLLCSDGLTHGVPDAKIEAILSGKAQIETICAQLIAAANHAGGEDNVTVLLIRAVE